MHNDKSIKELMNYVQELPEVEAMNSNHAMIVQGLEMKFMTNVNPVANTCPYCNKYISQKSIQNQICIKCDTEVQFEDIEERRLWMKVLCKAPNNNNFVFTAMADNELSEQILSSLSNNQVQTAHDWVQASIKSDAVFNQIIKQANNNKYKGYINNAVVTFSTVKHGLQKGSLNIAVRLPVDSEINTSEEEDNNQ